MFSNGDVGTMGCNRRSLTNSLTHSPTLSLTHPLTNSLTHLDGSRHDSELANDWIDSIFPIYRSLSESVSE